MCIRDRSTSKLFESNNNSPTKQSRSPQRELANGTAMSESNRIRLSMAPTIQSVVSDLDSITTGSTMETFETSRDTPIPHERINLREEYQRGNQDLISNISSLHEMKTIDLSDSNNDLESPSHHAQNNKYFFSPDDGSIDVASPAKNVEELKSKFLKNENDTNSRVAESILTMDDLGINDTSSGRNTQMVNPEPALAGTLDKKDLNDIANMPDDSINDDPITVAKMCIRDRSIPLERLPNGWVLSATGLGSTFRAIRHHVQSHVCSPLLACLVFRIDHFGILFRRRFAKMVQVQMRPHHAFRLIRRFHRPCDRLLPVLLPHFIRNGGLERKLPLFELAIQLGYC